jgi:hypothetical protein
MQSVTRKLAVLATSVAMTLPAYAAPGLLAKFVNSPMPAATTANAKISPNDPGIANYADAWWVPSESGWGVNLLQQGQALVLVFYIFDDDRQPVWYRGVTTAASDGTFQGVVYHDTGTSFREPVFGPVPETAEVVGQIRFAPTSIYDGQVSYTIGSTTVNKQLTRATFTPHQFAGEHMSVVTARINACGEKSGDLSGSMQTEASINNGSASITLISGPVACAITGPFRQRGRLGQVTGGTYTCSDGSTGQASVDAWDTQGATFSAFVTTSSGSCTETGRIAGARMQ